jgi:hypothetical protein
VKEINLYLITGNPSCFSNGKQEYKLLCKDCAKILALIIKNGDLSSTCKETSVKSKCDRCGYENKNI